ncbi:MAG: type II toxin-antitoxin system VapC family toxin [Rubrobacteraceae bacterium]
MSFWDSSAIVPALSIQATSSIVRDLLREGDEMVVWWGTWTECAIAISRLKREGSWGEEYEEETRAALDGLAASWLEVEPTNELRLLAMLVSKIYPLKAADCLQLAAALRWCEGDTEGAGFVCLDNRLRQAAEDEGFEVLPESEKF